jgi:formate dehydrogenase subunit gamma
MQRWRTSIFLLGLILTAGLAAATAYAQQTAEFVGLTSSVSSYYSELVGVITGDWQKYGELFTMLQSEWFRPVFLAVIVAVPAVFALHYIIVGAKHFDHDGEQILFFSMYNRVVHLIAAVSFTFLVITGLLIIFGSYFGGGTFIRTARYIHLISALIFALPGVLMFAMWIKDMLPQWHDIAWVFILGGYLSKKKKPVPAGKFNAGQKMYFWFATVGGGLMAYSGYLIWSFSGALDTVRIFTIIHNVLGMAIVAFYLTHVYMSVFAIAGSLESIKTGYKPKEEVDILHSRYKYTK